MRFNKRISVLCLCLVLLFNISVPRKSYAFAGTLTVASLALTLIAAAGVTYVGSNSGDITAAVNEFLAKNPEQKTFLENLITNGRVGQQIILTSALLKQFKDGFMSFFNAVRSFFSVSSDDTGVDSDYVGSITFPSVEGWNLSFDNVLPYSDFYNGDLVVNSPFMFSAYVHHNVRMGTYTFGCLLSCFTDDYGSSHKSGLWRSGYGNVPSQPVNSYVFSASSFGGDHSASASHRSHFSSTFSFPNPAFVSVLSNVPTQFNFYSVYSDYPDFLFFTTDSSDFSFSSRLWSPTVSYSSVPNQVESKRVCGVFFDGVTYADPELIDWLKSGRIDLDSFFLDAPLPVNSSTVDKILSYSYSFPQDITYEDVVSKWADALNGESDVVINGLTAGDTAVNSGYNLAYGGGTVTAPAVEGVDLPAGVVDIPDVPVNPDLPVTPDLGGIVGLLQSILSTIKSLPSLIANAVIGDGKLDFSALSNIELDKVFPFCIPFDLYNSFRVFNVPPVKPVFSIDFSNTVLSPVGVLSFDLEQFDSLFKIVRFFTYSGFVVSLILVTRRLIKG